MADISQVRDALKLLCVTAVYPNGITQPSVADVTITCASGWPEPGEKQLDAILAAGNAMVTVYPIAGMDANTTRFLAQMEVLTTIPPAELTLTVSGNKITVGGTIKAGEAACANVNYLAYSYGVLSTDTIDTIAAALAAKIPNATASGAVITITQVFEIIASVSVPVSMQQEIGRQTHMFMITSWCPTPVLRDLIAPAIDVFLKQQFNKRILLQDNTLARLIYRGTVDTDHLAKQNIYRRDLRYEVEYVTTSQETDNTVTNFATSISANGNPATTTNI